MDKTMADSGYGALIGRVGELDYLLSKPGMAITPDDITAEEFVVLRLIDDERAKYTKEVGDRQAAEVRSQTVSLQARKARRITD